MDELEGYLDWLRGHGVSFEVSPQPHRDEDHDGPLVRGEGATAVHALPGHGTVLEHRDRAGGIAADHATDAVAGVLARDDLVPRGATAWDVGCGTGVLAVAMARLGAARVVATDVSPEALNLAARTASAAAVTLDLRQSDLLSAFGDAERADLVVANLPHKPVPPGLGIHIAQDGGQDGAAVHGAFADQVQGRLRPGGRVVFFLHSLPDPRLLHRYAAMGRLHLRAWKRRWFQEGEYGALRAVFRERAAAGTSWIGREDGREYLLAGVWSVTSI